MPSTNHAPRTIHNRRRAMSRTAALLLVFAAAAWHGVAVTADAHPAHAIVTSSHAATPHDAHRDAPDLSGTWEIREEERTYYATLDAHGNGPYTHEGGSFVTTDVDGLLWSGTWAQTGNDRGGGFEVRLSEDWLTAKGTWWYTRVGFYSHIPPRMHGGTYLFRRLPPGEPIPSDE